MKKEKVIRLTENDLVNIIKRVLIETNEPTDKLNELRKELTGLTGSEIIMYNAAGFNKYKGEKGILKQYETYRIDDVWFPEFKGGITMAFNVTPVGSTYKVSGDTGLLKGAFKREKKDTSLPIQFRWDCYSYFEKGLGGKTDGDMRRYGGIKQDYINFELANLVTTRPFCTYSSYKTQEPLKVERGKRYDKVPR